MCFDMEHDMDIEAVQTEETHEELYQKYLAQKEKERIERYKPEIYGIKPEKIPNELEWTSHHEHVANGYFQEWIKRRSMETIQDYAKSERFLYIFRERFAKLVLGLSRIILTSVPKCLEYLCYELSVPHEFPKEGDHYKIIKIKSLLEDRKTPGEISVHVPMECCYIGRTRENILEDFRKEDVEELQKK